MPKSDLHGSLDIVQRYILALVGAASRAPIRERLWLQKELFVLAKQHPKLGEACGFSAHLQGPFSDTADEALKDLKNLGLVDYDSYGGNIRLTSAGAAEHEDLVKRMPSEVRDRVEEMKEFLNDLTENELLVFVYYSYPDMTQESVLTDIVEKNRLRCSISLFRKGKVSLEKAAQLAGMTVAEFRKVAGGGGHSS